MSTLSEVINQARELLNYVPASYLDKQASQGPRSPGSRLEFLASLELRAKTDGVA